MKEAPLRAAKTTILSCLAAIVAAPLALLLPSGESVAADAPCTRPDTPLRPVASTHTIPPYPSLSQMTGEQGTTLVEVLIGADGVVVKADVLKSSGSLRLDQAAADYVKANWRWEPTIRNCQPKEVATRVSIVWNLKEQNDGPPPGLVSLAVGGGDFPAAALVRHEQGIVVLMMALSETGEVMRTLVQVSSGFQDLDDKALELAKARKWTAAQMGGKPVPTLIAVYVNWKLPDGGQQPAR